MAANMKVNTRRLGEDIAALSDEQAGIVAKTMTAELTKQGF